MKIIYTILFFLIFVVTNIAQTSPYFLKIDSPEFIPVNSSFEISAVIKLTDINADSLDVYLFSDEDIAVQKLICRSFLESDEVSLAKTQTANSENLYSASIDLSSWELGNTIFLQLTFLLECQNYSSEMEKELAVAISLGNKGSSEDISRSLFKMKNDSYYEIPVKFYNPQRISGSSLSIDKNSKVYFSLQQEAEIKNLLVEFWAKFSEPGLKFFNILNKENRDTLLTLGDNFYQMLSLSGIEEKTIYDDFFLSDETWNHISIYLSPDKFRAEIYANGKILFSIPMNNFTNLHQLKFELSNNSTGKPYQIDLLKIWDFNNNLDLSFRNKNYLSFKADSSNLIAGFAFDKSENLNNIPANKYLKITIENPALEKSNAPIFSQAPKLNIELFNDFYSLEWINQESETPEEFVLEKSIDGKSYFPIFNVKADEEKEGNYVFTDPKENTAELIYYRVKQINEDGLEVYSSPVKIGQGKQENFILEQNYPNPFNPKTIINVDILRDTELEVNIYNLVGMKVAKIYEGNLPQGLHKFTFDGSNQPSGIYFCEVKSPSATQVRKMILTK